MVSVTDKKTGTTSKESLDVEQWLAATATSYPPPELDVIRRACDWAQRAHSGQRRHSGEPFFQHSLAVANILLGLRLDHETIAAALLHDVIEDTPITYQEIEASFGPRIAKLVDGVTKMEAIQTFPGVNERGGKKEHAHTEALRKMLLAMAEDIRVVLIKLADRTHNMRTLAPLPAEKQLRIAEETLHIYAPLANRLGIWQIKWELEDLSLRVLHPEAYKQIAGMVNERRVDRERYIAQFIKILADALKAAGIQAEISGRPKHIYSIWLKMQRKNTDYHNIYDIRAVRILVQHVRDCYAALGIVHGLWQYIPGEFDDYIATPKENNYQSIHSAVIGPEGKTVEVQIRTYDMHHHSELGVAAHWRYKEGSGQDAGLDRKVALLRQLLEWKEDISQTGEAGDEELQSDLFQDRVYVFSPRGDIIDMPVGSTPLDFAYHIHTELGNRCRGAKVNGSMVSLTYTLQTGQQVEVLTIKKGVPSRDWLNPHLGYLKTSRARHKVQHWFKQQNMEANINAGRAIFERDMQRLGYTGVNYEDVARRLNYPKVDDMLAAIGRGDVKTSRVLHILQELQPLPENKPELPIQPGQGAPQRHGGGDIQILGVGNLMTNLGRCCSPVPGDEIVGFITRGRGVTIHRRDCSNVLRYQNDNPQRLIEVEWGGTTLTYPVDIHITAFDRHGLLRDITSVLANEKINVIAVQTLSDKSEHIADMTLTLEIADIDELSKMLQKLSQLPNIIEVKRERR
ncbi:MAG: GTP diphosphokinase [Gammaproteobacteria bacterium]|jgi:GTP pyrophosphokinase